VFIGLLPQVLSLFMVGRQLLLQRRRFGCMQVRARLICRSTRNISRLDREIIRDAVSRLASVSR
jgi:hypothetical protein